MNKESNAINWFEIPVTDTPRAKKFYETIFGVQMETMDFNGYEMTMLPAGEMNVGGALVKHADYQPAKGGGPVIYLNANPSIQAVIDRVQTAGGNIILPRTQISEEWGYMALFTDSEGNFMGLHASE